MTPQFPPLDQGDADALDHLRDSEGWRLLLARIHEQIVREAREIESDQDASATARTRGSLRTLRMLAALPETMSNEIRGNLNAERKRK